MIYLYSSREKFEQKIDLKLIYQAIDKNKLIYNSKEFDIFFENWKAAIYYAYHSERNTSYNLQSEHFFRESLFFSNHEIRLHFNIDLANKIALSQPIQQISIDEFGFVTESHKQISTIKYSHIQSEDTLYDYSQCDNPVLAIIFCQYGYLYLIIDGNHRISSKRIHNINTVNTILLSPEQTLDIMISDFEKSLFLFQFEGFLLHLNDYSIIKKSNSRLFINNHHPK